MPEDSDDSFVKNGRSYQKLRRTLRTSDRKKYKDRLSRRNARRKQPKKYYSETVHADGRRSWSGGRDLSESAAYPAWFCRAILSCWAEQYKADGFPQIAIENL